MNERRIAWLAGLLIVQLLVVAALLFARGGFREPARGPLLAFEAATVDGIRIEETDAAVVELARGAEGWTLAGGLPADEEKVAKLLEKLAGLSAPWPVATTASARERFEVGDSNRQRLVRLSTGERTVAELLLGTSPGFRRLHVRLPGAEEVYEVDLTHFELATSADEWVDRALLAADGEVTSVAREGHWRVARSDDGWMLDDGAADAAKAEQMADRFVNLRVLGIAQAAEDGESAEPVAVFAVADSRGRHALRLYGNPDAAEYVVESDRQPGRFRLAAFVAEQLLLENEALLPGSSAADPASAADPGSEGEPAAAAAARAAEPTADDGHDH